MEAFSSFMFENFISKLFFEIVIKDNIFVFIVDETFGAKEYYKFVSTTTTTSHVFSRCHYIIWWRDFFIISNY